MKTNKILLIVLTALISTQLFAANIFSNKTPKKSNGELGSKIDAKRQRVIKLLSKEKISQKNVSELMHICLKTPNACTKLDVFSQLPANEIMKDGQSFAHKLFRQYAYLAEAKHSLERQKASGCLFFELIDWPFLDPHSSKKMDFLETAHNDLALDILRNSETSLINKLLSNKKFNPNNRYGYYRFSLTSTLIEENKFAEAIAVAKHSHFDGKIRDDNRNRPANFLLKKYAVHPQAELLKLLMPTKINEWNLNGLNLFNADYFSALLNDALGNDNDRSVVFPKIVDQLYILTEQDEKNALFNNIKNYGNNRPWANNIANESKLYRTYAKPSKA